MINYIKSSITKLAVSGALAISCIAPVAANNVTTASAATPSLVVKTSRVTTAKSGVSVGDVKIEIKLSQKVNLNSLGLIVDIGDGLAYRKNGSSLVYDKYFPTNVGAVDNSKASVASVGENNTGNLVTLYAYKTNSLNSWNGTVSVGIKLLNDTNGNKVQLSNVKVEDTASTRVNINPSTGYVLGDANGDGKVNSNDSVTILSMLENHNVNSVSVFTVANNLSYWLPKAKAAEAADAYRDNVINKSDSTAILNYYADSLVQSYSGNIGKTFYTIKAV